tara:strand:+ start:868 stop:1059 length:192 start_codon:yes stop_codon:yes gene_type:complete
MNTWEPDGWNFDDSGVKLHVYGDDDSNSNSSGEISGDDQLFTNCKNNKRVRYKKITKEKLLPE